MNSVRRESRRSPWPLSKISVELEGKIYATFKSVNSFTVDNPFCYRREAPVFLFTTTDLTFLCPKEKEKKSEKEGLEGRVHFNAGTIYSASIIFISVLRPDIFRL